MDSSFTMAATALLYGRIRNYEGGKSNEHILSRDEYFERARMAYRAIREMNNISICVTHIIVIISLLNIFNSYSVNNNSNSLLI